MVTKSREVLNRQKPKLIETSNAKSLPSEVLKQILIFHITSQRREREDPYCLWNEPTNDNPPAFHTAAIILSHVSRKWRSLSISIPSLWSTIYLEGEIQSPYEVVKMYLQRAGTLPLSLKIHCGWSTIRPVVWNLLLEHSVQWKHIDFAYEGKSFTKWEQIIPERFPLLESVRLEMNNSHVTTELFKTFSECPSLREVDYRTDFFYSIYMYSPFAQLTKIILPSSPMSEILLILESCANVEILDLGKVLFVKHEDCYNLNARYTKLTPFRPPGRILLSNLREIKFSTAIDPFSLFDHLNVPALQSIAMDYIHDDGVGGCFGGFEAFAEMLRHSRCLVKHFSVRFFAWQRICPAFLELVLRAPEMQSCETLELIALPNSKRVIRALTMPHVGSGLGREGLLPVLREVKFHWGVMGEAEGVGIEEMIRSRMPQRRSHASPWMTGRLRKAEVMLQGRRRIWFN